MVHETDAFFSVGHLQEFMKQGQWRDAIAYLSRFLQLGNLSIEAQVLHRFLFVHKNLAEILADTKEGHALADYFRQYRRHDITVCHGNLRLRSIMLTALHAKEHLRVSFGWERVRHQAAKIAYNLVHRTPELKGVVALPAGPLNPHNVFPICTRYRQKKHPCLPRASGLAKRYLQKRGSLLSSSPSKESDNELHGKAANWIADILDESLQANRPLELHQKLTPQTSGNKATPSKPILQGTFGTLTDQSRIFMAS